MRRTYISPEFEYNKVYGTFNMKEQSSFFGSKMLEIDDMISIKNDNIIYYQLSNGEQIDIRSESGIYPQIIYDAVLDKKTNHTIIIDESQTEYEKSQNARWIVDIQIQNILRNYIFATLKKFRTFEGVRNNMTINNSINSSISFDEFVFRDETTQPLSTLDYLDDLMECRLYSFILNSLYGEEKEYFEKQIIKARLLFKVQQSRL